MNLAKGRRYNATANFFRPSYPLHRRAQTANKFVVAITEKIGFTSQCVEISLQLYLVTLFKKIMINDYPRFCAGEKVID